MLLPLVGSLIVARGIFVAAIAVLYAVFAWAAFRRKAWAWPVGMLVAVVNALLAVISALTGSGGLGTLLWAVVPVILIVYLLTPTGRGALSNVRPGP
jgi:hypothetical protein